MIPGLKDAQFARYGVMHRNTFINSPKLLNKYYQTIKNEKLFFAGQITGVEGYVESASSGLVAGINMAKLLSGEQMVDFTKLTATGGLTHYISEDSVGDFQPMNVTFGIIEPLGYRVKGKREKNAQIAQRAIEKLREIKEKYDI